MLRAYFDDAGTHRGSPVVVLGGLIGTVGQWEKFEQAWGRRLGDPLPEVQKAPLSSFHLRPCILGHADFADYKPVEREATARNFRDIIHAAGLASTASAVDRVAWDELVTGKPRELLGDAIEPCFLHCLDRARDYAFDHPEGERIVVMFDKGIESERLHDIINLYLKHIHLDIKHDFSSITFGRVKEHFSLQGADIIATESYWHADRWLTTGGTAEPRPPARQFWEHMPAEGLIMDRGAIITELGRRNPDGSLPTPPNVLLTRGMR
jgi:uncharacterized protein DUF3800